jgi:hypothetical protein
MQSENTPVSVGVKVCAFHDDQYKMIKEMHERLVGNDEKPGVFERLRSLEATKKLMISAIVAGAISLCDLGFTIVKGMVHIK